MNPKNTNTGAVLEAMVLHALERGGYLIKQQQAIGKRPSGRTHKVDVTAEKDGCKFIISLKWQQVRGTVEQKVPFEIICLVHAIKNNEEFKRAYLVSGGEGWTLREFYLGNELKEYLTYDSEVTIITLERFISIANDGKL